MLPLGQIIRHFKGISYHCYVNDIQLYVSFKPQNIAKLSVLDNWINALKDWMADNFLQLNAEKNEILTSALPSVVPKIRDGLGSITLSVKSFI